MGEVLELIGGDPISCSDGPCGSLGRLIVEPTSKRITHISVQPKGLLDEGRLVAIGLVRSGHTGLELTCTPAELDATDPDETSQLVLVPGGLRPGSLSPAWVTTLALPDGEFALNGDEPILATDGHAGHLRGIAVNIDDSSIAKLFLEVGHFSSKHRVEVPAPLITMIDDAGLHLGLSKADVAKFG